MSGPKVEPKGARAFPVVGVDGVWDPGMTLRDYFAAKALPSFIEGYPAENAAQQAYKYADAMIASRSTEAR